MSYISDYVTKPTLKTHQIFASMYDVFEKHTTSSIPKDKEDSARQLILKIVNSLSSKLEIGSPMAAMYLLGNPDHYTGYDFVSFWWKTYVNDVKRFWAARDGPPTAQSEERNDAPSDNSDCINTQPTEGIEAPRLHSDQVLLRREDDTFVATSKSDDYKYRPAMYETMSLYEWIQTSDWRSATKKEKESIQDGTFRSGRSTYLLYEEGYPLRSSRLVRCVAERKTSVVPNIVGGALPRHDQGDREHYCCAMLTIFKNWRSGKCLKNDRQSWDDAFRSHNFTENQMRLMKNFNLRYECLDTRDDFHAQLKSKSKVRGEWTNQGDTDEEEDGNYIPEIREYDDYEHAGRIYLSNQNMISAANKFLSASGWSGKHLGELPPLCERLVAPAAPSGGWSNFIKTCKDAIFKQRFANYVPPDTLPENNSHSTNEPELVRILSSDYFNKDFRAAQESSHLIINETASAFSLNTEQLRGFRIIANHASALAPDQLLMYLGGMGGTGKSQVIKSLMHLFKERNESYRFMVLAPTGTAAALLNGSTYHKALAVNRQNEVGEDFSKNTSTIVNEVQERYQGVDYVFIDEVSMISCSDLYTISARFAQVTGIHDVPFGGKNIIVAGDFAQLAPVFGSPLYDQSVEKYLDVGMSVKKEQSVIGRMIWHQFTTVVILKQNMRQRTQTEEDSKLCTCLENMRYAACTSDDIAFLRSRIAGKGMGSPDLGDVRFRNVSIITARNNQKDAMNEEGSKRFAADYGQELEHFYSLDTRAGSSDDIRTKGRRRKRNKGTTDTLSSGLSRKDQEALWECSPHMSGGVAAKLSLCVGMPVIICNNEATELCITKGQEAVVVGWDAGPAPYGRQTLNTLYVRLENPPKDVKIADLPPNVVPLTRITTTEHCMLKSDRKISISRQQIPVLPNFGMTDYSAQGKTRPNNPVDLGLCRDHLSYYTCLSRSASAKGTILVQDFSPSKITGGISGWLRQEFRELNALDEITCLKYEGLLPDGIHSALRNPTIRAYYLWMNDRRDDADWHESIRYANLNQRLQPVEVNALWDTNISLMKTGEKKNSRSKRLLEITSNIGTGKKRPRNKSTFVSFPRGTVWDHVNYSCAYDALFTVLFNVWVCNRSTWSRRFGDMSDYAICLAEGFGQYVDGRITLERARNMTCTLLHADSPDEFPFGYGYASVQKLCYTLMGKQSCGYTTLKCDRCDYLQLPPVLDFAECTRLERSGRLHDNSLVRGRISEALSWDMIDDKLRSDSPCTICESNDISPTPSLHIAVQVKRLPYLLAFSFLSSRFLIDKHLVYKGNNVDIKYDLRGVVYGGYEHFFCRVITEDGWIWFHDGRDTGSVCIRERNIADLSDIDWLNYKDTKDICKPLIAIYVRV